MKRFSIKARVTLWYTVLMLLIILLVLFVMVIVGNRAVESGTKNQLVMVVDENADEVDFDDGFLEVDDDFLPFINGVYTALYTENLVFMQGQAPADFDAEPEFVNGVVRDVEAGGKHYYLHDRLLSFDGHADIWVRGIVLADANAGIVSALLRFMFIALPILALLAALGGYWIARQSFAPIERIRATAVNIGESGDLSRRIDIGEGDDELHRLANTFDDMFAQLEASFEAENQFTADASHELRTPTAVILAQCEYIRAHIDGLAQGDVPGDAQREALQEYKEALEVIERQAGKMSRLISQLLAFSRMERGIEPDSFTEEDVSGLVRMIAEEQNIEGIKDIHLHADIQEDIRAKVDVTLFTRLVTNLLSNAYRYGREDGNITVSLRQSGGEVRLSVEDDGAGIAPEQQEKVWQRFYQADPSRSAAEEGSMGLGLAMVKQIARLHGGRMELESEPGRGSRFTFAFPANVSFL